ncbi:MAG: 3-dehydroquinate synthase [Chitinophagaceae bacterium]|nr:3-dehydroquinate synthase [Chitinophagaceae bacterium]
MSTLFFDGQEKQVTELLNSYEHHIVLVDAKTNGFCLLKLTRLLPILKSASILIIPDGEEHKTLDVLSLLWEQLTTLHASKKTLLINLGGGVLCDLGGFAASTFKRGIACLHIPTTLTAMVDAAIGGKTGIDWMGYKNLIGSFYEPVGIYIQPSFLETLPEKHLRSGMVEMWKHALIHSEEAWQSIKQKKLAQFLTLEVIQNSLQVKLNLVEQDPFDEGVRQALNLGHTIGHAVEAWSLNNKRLLHGEAVLLGLIAECELAEQLLGLSSSIRNDLRLLKRTYFPNLSFQGSMENLLPYLLQDKKNEQGIRMSLLKNPGDVAIQVSVPTSLILKLGWHD